MKRDARQLLLSLQHADSFFPSGSISFSWGLEALATGRRVTDRNSLENFILGQLEHRWSSFDRPVLSAAYQAGANLDEVGDIDRLVESQTLVAGIREGSRQNGQALLTVHKRLDTSGAREYSQKLFQQQVYGHLTVMQGFLWRGIGLAEEECQAMSAYSMSMNFVSAALRLGLVGHVDGQKILSRLNNEIASILSSPVVSLEDVHAFTPELDVAIMLHESCDTRLFAN